MQLPDRDALNTAIDRSPIAAEAVSGGFEVAWKNGAADQFIAWRTDVNGDGVAGLVPAGAPGPRGC